MLFCSLSIPCVIHLSTQIPFCLTVWLCCYNCFVFLLFLLILASSPFTVSYSLDSYLSHFFLFVAILFVTYSSSAWIGKKYHNVVSSPFNTGKTGPASWPAQPGGTLWLGLPASQPAQLGGTTTWLGCLPAGRSNGPVQPGGNIDAVWTKRTDNRQLTDSYMTIIIRPKKTNKHVSYHVLMSLYAIFLLSMQTFSNKKAWKVGNPWSEVLLHL